MYVLYTDESGKSGLHDPVQPFHVLGGVVVHDQGWLALEADLNARIDALLPPPRVQKWELHMTDMWNGKKLFAGMPRTVRENLWTAVLDVIDLHRPTIFMMVVDKVAHVGRYITPDTPERLTYEFMIERFDKFVGRQTDKVGMIIADDAKGQEDTIRLAHARYRQQGTTWQQINHVVETPFFVPSHYSCMLQIVDVAAWWCARALRTEGRANIATGPTALPEWGRIRQHLDKNPANGHVTGFGFKIFP